MFLGESIVTWFFVACYIVCFIVTWVSLKRVCQQLNQVLPVDEKVSLFPPIPRSFGQLVWRTNILTHSLDLLSQHSKHYPASRLRVVNVIAVIGATLGTIAMIVCLK
jgi:hypothetical protein